MAGKHDWNSWDNYQQIHSRHLADFEYFIVLENLLLHQDESEIRIRGALHCLSDIRIEIDMTLDVELRNGRPFVRTAKYKYHALYSSARRNLLRYDNVHPHRGHPDEHHKHLYDLPKGHPRESEGRVIHVGADGWPTLSEFLDEVIAKFHTG